MRGIETSTEGAEWMVWKVEIHEFFFEEKLAVLRNQLFKKDATVPVLNKESIILPSSLERYTAEYIC